MTRNDILSLRNAIAPVIETARLVLRQPDRRDVRAIARLANNPKIHAMTARLPHPYTEAHAISFVDHFATRDTERAYTILLRPGTFIGVAGLTLGKDTPPELGYWIGEPYWGKGYGSEAVRALLGAALTTGRCPAIVASVRSENLASRRILEKLGFALEEEAVAECGPHLGVSVARYRYGEGKRDYARSA